MKRWDFDSRPYRPVRKVMHGAEGTMLEEQPDAFIDAKGRIWYATEKTMADLPSDPTALERIPSEFWHPDAANVASLDEHKRKKQQIEDARAEVRFGA